MNYLAHIYLSENDEFITIGNFMADSVKGNQYLSHPIGIQIGIKLHRFIDSYTDSHPVYRNSKHRLTPFFGHFSGIIMDIFYDHFLAKNFEKYSKKNLVNYADNFYKTLHKHFDLLTDHTKNVLPIMQERNWLVCYETIAGIQLILFQMDYRTKLKGNMVASIPYLEKFYTEFETDFFIFFDELMESCKTKLKELKNEYHY